MNINSLRLAAAATLLAAAGVAGATTVTVSAHDNSIGGGSALLTGVTFAAGQTFSVTVDPLQTWQFDPNPFYTSNADGKPGYAHSATAPTGQTFTALIGTLVGEIGNGDFFAVGTNYSGTATTAGELKFFYWDSDAWNNLGSVQANITAVPEPTSALLMGLGLAALGATARRRKA